MQGPPPPAPRDTRETGKGEHDLYGGKGRAGRREIYSYHFMLCGFFAVCIYLTFSNLSTGSLHAGRPQGIDFS